MWAVHDLEIIMTEGDWGVALPITINGVTFTEHDEAKLTIKAHPNGAAIIEKEFSNITQNTVSFELTAAESALLPVGSYVYSLDWFQDGAFLCNIIPCAAFKVVDKA